VLIEETLNLATYTRRKALSNIMLKYLYKTMHIYNLSMGSEAIKIHYDTDCYINSLCILYTTTIVVDESPGMYNTEKGVII
jgi:hypothetical protein